MHDVTILMDVDHLLACYGVNVTNFPIVLVQIIGDMRCSADLSMGTIFLFISNQYIF
jgi:hypothetical protein